MEVLGLIFVGLGTVVTIVGGIWILVLAFKESPLWGIGSLLCNLVSLVFVILHWAEAKKPFFIQLGGVGAVFLGMALGGTAMTDQPEDGGEIALLQPVRTARDQQDSELESAMATTPDSLMAPKSNTPEATRPKPSSQPQARRQGRTQSRRSGRTPAVTQPSESGSEASPTAPAKEPEVEPLLLPGQTVPVQIEVVRVQTEGGAGMGSLDLRVSNHTRKTVKQIRMTVYYFGKNGDRLKEWKTSLYDPEPALDSGVTIEVTQPAFFMPRYTASAALQVDMLGFDDGTEWRR